MRKQNMGKQIKEVLSKKEQVKKNRVPTKADEKKKEASKRLKKQIAKRNREIEKKKIDARNRNDRYLKKHDFIFRIGFNPETGWYDYESFPYVDTTKMPYDLAIQYHPTERSVIYAVRKLNNNLLNPYRLMQAIFGGELDTPPEYKIRYNKKNQLIDKE